MVLNEPIPSLRDILSAPITKDELTEEFCNEKDEAFLSKFEEAWQEFLTTKKKQSLPRGKRLDKIEALKEELQQLEMSKRSIEVEMKKQLEFFRMSREKLEQSVDDEMRKSTKKQRAIHQELTQQLENAKTAESIQKQTLPWFNFLEEINSLSVEQELSNESSESSMNLTNSDSEDRISRAPRPSNRAIFLLQNSQPEASQGDLKFRGYQTDNAILKAHVQMLKKEIRRVEYLSLTQEYSARFLKEYRVSDFLSCHEPTKEPKEDSSICTQETDVTGGSQ